MLEPVWNESKISKANEVLENMTAKARVLWALEHLPEKFALSSSFGVQSAVSLHLITQVKPDIPVILIDTGYLFPETYRFVESLQARLKLNLKVYRAAMSSAWQEAKYGKLWEKGVDGLNRYNQLNKVEPMEKALDDLGIVAWFAGLMRNQSESRKGLKVLQKMRGRLKVHPIIDWNNKTVHQYLKKHQLPYHPLWEKGYVSIGDAHSTVPLTAGMAEEATRFGGLKRECGLHEDTMSGL